MGNKSEELKFRGIHYVRISQLPQEQKDLFLRWLPKDQVIKIQIDQDILPDCVQYHHYEHWFDHIKDTMREEGNEQEIGISVQ